MSQLRILLLSGYDAASHRCWRENLTVSLPQFDWTTLTLPDRHFYWRARGNALTFASQYRETLERSYDLLIATSMVDLATLRGFVPKLASLPSIVYFHENQFAYPTRNPNPNIVNAQLTSIYTALCAEKILFNSQYNCDTFYHGAQLLLKRLPDGVPKGLLAPLLEKSQILPVPILAQKQSSRVALAGTTIEIVWNHRWEYDKQPQVFFAALRQLRVQGLTPRVHVLGQSFRQVPDCFELAKTEFAEQIVSWGFQPTLEYYAILCKADIVVSTALHDFQGLSMLEAIHRGCVPVAPARVAYPAYVPTPLLYDVGDENTEAIALAAKLHALLTSQLAVPNDLSADCYLVDHLAAQYGAVLESLSADHH